MRSERPLQRRGHAVAPRIFSSPFLQAPSLLDRGGRLLCALHVQALLAGHDVHFGRPVEKAWQGIRQGIYHPRVASLLPAALRSNHRFYC